MERLPPPPPALDPEARGGGDRSRLLLLLLLLPAPRHPHALLKDLSKSAFCPAMRDDDAEDGSSLTRACREALS